jgi:hypothetical protein
MTEGNYRTIIDSYLNGDTSVDEFIDAYMNQWKEDRDSQVDNDPRFRRLSDRIFTSCDCYYAEPEGDFEISEAQLREEVSLLRYIWFG